MHVVEPAEPVVDAFVVPAHENDAIERCTTLGFRLIERASRSAGHHDEPSFFAGRGGRDRIERPCDWLEAQHHAGAASEGRIVGALARFQVLEQMMVVHLDETGFHRAAEYGEADERREELGKERDEIDREHAAQVFANRPEFACALEALERRDFENAERELEALLSRGESEAAPQAFLYNKRGVARIGLGQRDAAREDFMQALHLQPHHAGALTNLGNLALEDDDVEGAIAHYERAIAADAEYAVAYFNLGVAYKKAGRIAEGVRALRQAQRLEWRARKARFSLGRLRPFRSS